MCGVDVVGCGADTLVCLTLDMPFFASEFQALWVQVDVSHLQYHLHADVVGFPSQVYEYSLLIAIFARRGIGGMPFALGAGTFLVRARRQGHDLYLPGAFVGFGIRMP